MDPVEILRVVDRIASNDLKLADIITEEPEAYKDPIFWTLIIPMKPDAYDVAPAFVHERRDLALVAIKAEPSRLQDSPFANNREFVKEIAAETSPVIAARYMGDELRGNDAFVAELSAADPRVREVLGVPEEEPPAQQSGDVVETPQEEEPAAEGVDIPQAIKELTAEQKNDTNYIFEQAKEDDAMIAFIVDDIQRNDGKSTILGVEGLEGIGRALYVKYIRSVRGLEEDPTQLSGIPIENLLTKNFYVALQTEPPEGVNISPEDLERRTQLYLIADAIAEMNLERKRTDRQDIIYYPDEYSG